MHDLPGWQQTPATQAFSPHTVVLRSPRGAVVTRGDVDGPEANWFFDALKPFGASLPLGPMVPGLQPLLTQLSDAIHLSSFLLEFKNRFVALFDPANPDTLGSVVTFLSDQVALEALVRFSDEECDYRFDVDPNPVAHVVLGKSIWAVLALTPDIELLTQLHYRQSIDPDSGLYRAVQGRLIGRPGVDEPDHWHRRMRGSLTPPAMSVAPAASPHRRSSCWHNFW
jgi:hypothetical protein